MVNQLFIELKKSVILLGSLNLTYFEREGGKKMSAPVPSTSHQEFCRICQEGDEFESLIMPCNCRGSVGFAHASCLQTWVSGRLERTSAPRCEICKAPYNVSYKYPHKGPFQFLFSCRSPPIVCRTWASLLFCVASVVLFFTRESLTIKCTAFSIMILSTAALFRVAYPDLRSMSASAVLAYVALLGVTAPAIGFTVLCLDCKTSGSDKSIWDFQLQTRTVRITWKDSERLAMIGVDAMLLGAAASWVVYQLVEILRLIFLSRADPRVIWTSATAQQRAWFTLVLYLPLMLALCKAPCAMMPVFVIAITATIAFLLVLHFFYASDALSKTVLFCCVISIIVISTGFIAVFLFVYPSPKIADQVHMEMGARALYPAVVAGEAIPQTIRNTSSEIPVTVLFGSDQRNAVTFTGVSGTS